LAESHDNAFLIMPDRSPSLKPLAQSIVKSSLAILAAISISSCSGSTGPAVAQTLTLYTVDRNFLPAAIKNPDGRVFTIGVGRLQGSDIGPSCGMSVQLATGPIASAEVPNCKLGAGEEFTFTATLNDSRFPAGPHEYRFVPP
jgi:hypothetical protein